MGINVETVKSCLRNTVSAIAVGAGLPLATENTVFDPSGCSVWLRESFSDIAVEYIALNTQRLSGSVTYEALFRSGHDSEAASVIQTAADAFGRENGVFTSALHTVIPQDIVFPANADTSPWLRKAVKISFTAYRG